MHLLITPDGTARCLYTEDLPLVSLGAISITRASHIEPDATGRWWADLSPSVGPKLGPFARRSLALAAEERWLTQNLLAPAPGRKDPR